MPRTSPTCQWMVAKFLTPWQIRRRSHKWNSAVNSCRTCLHVCCFFRSQSTTISGLSALSRVTVCTRQSKVRMSWNESSLNCIMIKFRGVVWLKTLKQACLFIQAYNCSTQVCSCISFSMLINKLACMDI